MNLSLTKIAAVIAFTCALPGAWAQGAGAVVVDGAGTAVYGSTGTTLDPSTGSPVFGAIASSATEFSALTLTPTAAQTLVTDGTNASAVTQTPTSFDATAAGSGVLLGPVGASLLRTNATSTVNSGYVAVDNAAAGGTFETGTGRQYNGTRTLFGPGLDTTQTGSFDASSNLATGLLTDGVAGTNTLLGSTSTNGIVNAGNIATTTLNVSGATTTNGIANTGHIATTSLSTTGNATVGGTLAVSGATTTNGIVNTGNIATTSLSTTGNANVGGTLAVSGATTTNGIDNSNQKITGVAPGTVSSSSTDAVNGSQLYQVSSAQATANANQAAINNNQALVNANQANINAAQSLTNQQMQAQTASNRKISSGGIASATATASMPALQREQKFGIGVGVGNYDGQSALAIGVAARVSEQLQLKFSVGTSGGGKTTVGAGGMYAW